MVSKPADCIFPYDFKEAMRRKVGAPGAPPGAPVATWRKSELLLLQTYCVVKKMSKNALAWYLNTRIAATIQHKVNRYLVGVLVAPATVDCGAEHEPLWLQWEGDACFR